MKIGQRKVVNIAEAAPGRRIDSVYCIINLQRIKRLEQLQEHYTLVATFITMGICVDRYETGFLSALLVAGTLAIISAEAIVKPASMLLHRKLFKRTVLMATNNSEWMRELTEIATGSTGLTAQAKAVLSRTRPT